MEDFVGAKVFCPHCLADISIGEKKLEFSSTTLPTPCPHRIINILLKRNKRKTTMRNKILQ